jgi:ABC-2 type transport system permease protein
MRRSLVVMRFALGELLAGRRLPIVAVVVALPLWLPSLLAPSSGQDPTSFSFDLFRNLVVPVLLPVVSFAFATAALGNELRRGTIANLLLKPIPRWSVLAAEYAAAVVATVLVLVPLVVIAQVLAARGAVSGVLLEATVVSTVAGVLVYSAIGVLLSLLLSRALLIGLAYALLWEGAVVGVAPSASSMSVRGYVEGILAAILDGGGGPVLSTRLGPVSATVLALVVTLLALTLAQTRLRRMDLP